ncbi:MAG: hypothetical protein V4568_14485 [Pseudomonadota bacterium]
MQQLSQEILNLIQSNITDLTLPASLNDTDNPPPAWINSLTKVTKVGLPDYQSESLDLQQMRPADFCSLYIGGENIREINACEKARIYTPDVNRYSNVIARLYRNDDGQPMYSGPTLGRAFVSGPGGKLDKTNHICPVDFEANYV